MKKKYDFAFSLGSVCGASQCLRGCKLQFTSGPFDWVGSCTVDERAQIIASDFADWLVLDDLYLVDIRRTAHVNRLLRSRKTGITFGHDFTTEREPAEEFAAIAAKYRRRIDRFMETMRKSKRILALYCETPIHPSPTNEQIIKAQAILERKFPEAEIDLVCFRQDDTCVTDIIEQLNERTVAVSVDYKLIEYGKVNHVFNFTPVYRYLLANAAVDDVRTEAEKLAYEAEVKRKREARWGSSPFERWCNRKLYKLYRHIEKMLINRKMIPPEGPANI